MHFLSSAAATCIKIHVQCVNLVVFLSESAGLVGKCLAWCWFSVLVVTPVTVHRLPLCVGTWPRVCGGRQPRVAWREPTVEMGQRGGQLWVAPARLAGSRTPVLSASRGSLFSGERVGFGAEGLGFLLCPRAACDQDGVLACKLHL